MKDHYATLGIGRDASGAEVRSAYRRKVAEWHPDRHGNSPESQRRFRQIQEAYEVVRDPTKRARYDLGEPVEERRSAPASKITMDEVARSYGAIVMHDVKWGFINLVIMVVSGMTLLIAVGGVWAWLLCVAMAGSLIYGTRSWYRAVWGSPLVRKILAERARRE
jgi:curved DNA-binding protein CbpA